MVKKIMNSVFVICLFLSGYAIEVKAAAGPTQEAVAPLFSTYLDEQLTPESLPLLATPPSHIELAKIRNWLNAGTLIRTQNGLVEGPTHKRIIKGLTTLKWPLAGETGDFSSQRNAIDNLLKVHGMQNLSQWNYLFAIPVGSSGSTKYIVQIAGILNRVKNLLVYNDPMIPGMQPLQDRTPDALCDSMIKKEHATYQTVSRVAHYLRAKEAIEKFNLDAIAIPNTFLVGIEEGELREATDDNSLVVQEYMDNLLALRSMERRAIALIPAEALRQTLILTVYAGFWDLKANLLFDARNGVLVITDFEQPNNSNPVDFFHKNESKVLGNIRCGINQINELFAKDTRPKVKAICQKFSQMSDKDLKTIGSGKLPDNVAQPIE